MAFLGDAHSLYDGNVHAAEEALLHVHSGLGQVVVRVEAGAVVDLVTHDRIGLVGGCGTELHPPQPTHHHSLERWRHR